MYQAIPTIMAISNSGVHGMAHLEVVPVTGDNGWVLVPLRRKGFTVTVAWEAELRPHGRDDHALAHRGAGEEERNGSHPGLVGVGHQAGDGDRLTA